MRPLLRALAALPLLLLGLTAGCGGGSHGASGETITYWANPETATPEQHAKVLQPLLDEFTKQTGIHVKLEMQDWTKVYAKIIAGVASDSLPDVFDTGATWAPALQATGGLMPFDSKAYDAIGGRAKFLATAIASTGVPGPTTAVVPLYGQAYGLFYNPTLFAAAGIKAPPTTWAEFETDARKLTKPGQWGAGFAGNGATINVHEAFIFGRQHGARLFSASGKPTFDTPAERAGIEQFLDLMSKDKAVDPDLIEKNGVDLISAFAQGHTGMILQQSAAIGQLDTLGFHDYAIADVPVLNPLPEGGDPVQSIVAGTNLAIAQDSRHKQADLALVKFLTSPAAQTTLNSAFGTLPVLNSLEGVKPFSSQAMTVFGQIQADHSEPMPLVPGEGAMEIVLGAELVKLWPKAENGTLTDADVGQALRAAQAQMPKN
ncbi:MAG TPA: extracellular solute-binding protein [Marmoricola sp.]|jgi:multiple sugar transport system substrate-binding protein|nr:extracellular solute-binding protein [Marmoricola sp.]